MVSATPPIRARKAKYYADPRLQSRILWPPSLPEQNHNYIGEKTPWTEIKTPSLIKTDALLPKPEDTANSGIRREPKLPVHEKVAPVPEIHNSLSEFDVLTGSSDETVSQNNRKLKADMRRLARQAALDPDDGIDL